VILGCDTGSISRYGAVWDGLFAPKRPFLLFV
jgi:hypothetical protein